MRTLPGAGPVTAARLAERGIATVRDLLARAPRGWADLRVARRPGELGDARAGEPVLVAGRVRRVHVFPRRLLDVWIEDPDGDAVARARWFRPPPGMSKRFVRGGDVAVAGPLRRNEAGEPELVHPQVVTDSLRAAGGRGLGVEPVYRRVAGVPSRTYARLIAGGLAHLGDDGDDVLPEQARRSLALPTWSDAVRALHRPDPAISVEELAALRAGRSAAHRRLAIEALLVAQVAMRMRRALAATRPALACAADVEALIEDVERALPFALTAAQRRAVADVAQDLARPTAMQRLLQGDVGTGKTVVVLAAALCVARAGGATVFMAPTELLVEQHAATLSGWATALGLRVATLTGGARAAASRRAAASGEVDLLIGTHALLDDALDLPRRALAVVDEQHRFGVAQRARLRAGSGGMMPHLLVLTATPIPRTLALALYGDLDVSRLDERPPGRRRVTTTVGMGADGRSRAYDALRAELAAGGSAFVVCPRVHDDLDDDEGSGALARARALSTELAPVPVALVHGGLPGAKQTAALRAFRSGRARVLVATTVVEVGVDVPTATLMIVESADRLGLAQLHQLRGRVGRGERAASCWLLTERAEARDRLELVAATTDGLRLAELDLARRGSGDAVGTRQAGAPIRGAAASLDAYVDLLAAARAAADDVLGSDPQLARPEHAPLARAVVRLLERGAGELIGEASG